MRIPPAGLFLAAAGAQHLLSPRLSTPALRTAAPLFAVAGGFGVGALREFRRAATTVDPVRVERASSLVTGGVFSISRNPMYVALAGALVAHAVARRSWVGLLPVAGFVAAIDRGQIPAEEAAMRERFGAAYGDYTARVRRWL